MSDHQIPADLATALDATVAQRGVFGARLFYAAEVGSTNDLAAAAAERGEPEGTTFVAGAQTAGRGRLGRSWFSPPGAGLYVSIVLRASLAPWITLAGGVAAAEGIRAATGLPVQIKWPNDIVAVGGAGPARRKIAGLLAEAASGPHGVHHVILGMGINLGPAAYPPELAGRAGSLEGELGRPVDAGPVLAAILAALNRTFAELVAAGPSGLLARWLALAPSARGAPIQWDSPSGWQTGVTAGIDADGALLARTSGGLARIIAGEVRWT